jgi:alcohol dehydrogenase YqhD (iron-dependent ADH family)
MKNFIYYTPTKIVFGKGEEQKVGKLIKDCGATKVLVHFGGGSVIKSGLLNTVEDCLEKENIQYIKLGGVIPNPELPLVKKGIELCLKEKVDFILAVGGGSVIDSAKAIACGAANSDKNVWDFFIGKDAPKASLKKGAILTLSAAGSEMSGSCVITNPETGVKKGFGSVYNRLDFAIENPELTYTVNPYQTACGAVDIAMHTLERYFCKGEDTYLTDALAEALLKSIMKAGVDAIKNPTDYTTRANMMWASSVAHNDLTHCGRDFLLAVHQLEHEISAKYPKVAHGAGLAALWCSWARYVYKTNINRFLQFSTNVWNLDVDFEHPEDTVLKAIKLQEEYYKSIGMPTNIKELGVTEEDLEYLALRCSLNKTRIIDGYMPLRYEDMLNIYKMAYNA